MAKKGAKTPTMQEVAPRSAKTSPDVARPGAIPAPTSTTVAPTDLAHTLGVDVRSLKNFVDQGMPKATRGLYPLRECAAWYVARERRKALSQPIETDLDRARLHKIQAETRLVEIEVGVALGELVPVAVVGEVVGKGCARMMAILQNAPSNFGQRLEAGGISAADAERLIEDLANELIEALRASADEYDKDVADDLEGEASGAAAAI